MLSCKKHKCTARQIKKYCKRPTKQQNKINCTRKFCKGRFTLKCEEQWCTPHEVATYDFSKWPIRGFRRRRLDCLASVKN